MKVLFVNKYFYPRGGSEVSMFETARLLESRGHEAIFFSMRDPANLPSPHEEYFVSPVRYDGSVREKISASCKLLYSFEARRNMDRLLDREQPDVIHLNNIYHQISPSVIDAAKKRGIPTVMTLHDYKMVCASYGLLSGGATCEACRGGRFYRCFLRGCVKGSRGKSLLNTLEMYLHHRLLRIYDGVDVFISPYSRFFEDKLCEMGFPHPIVHLQNLIPLERVEPRYGWKERSILYFGRLSPEKGVRTAMAAVRGIPGVTLKIVGDGPQRGELEEFAIREGIGNVRFLGYQRGEELREAITRSMFVLIPSEWYEPFAFTVIEAFALGKPVVGARIGGIPERVIHGETGLLFEPGNTSDLREKLEYLLANPSLIPEMGMRAKSFVDREYDTERYFRNLMAIYRNVVAGKPSPVFDDDLDADTVLAGATR